MGNCKIYWTKFQLFPSVLIPFPLWGVEDWLGYVAAISRQHLCDNKKKRRGRRTFGDGFARFRGASQSKSSDSSGRLSAAGQSNHSSYDITSDHEALAVNKCNLSRHSSFKRLLTEESRIKIVRYDNSDPKTVATLLVESMRLSLVAPGLKWCWTDNTIPVCAYFIHGGRGLSAWHGCW